MQKVSKDKVYIGIIAVLIVALAFLFLQQRSQPAEIQGVKDIYKIITEKEADILSVKDVSGLYKVTVRVTDAAGRSVVQDVFLTKDGVLFTGQPLVKVSDYIDSLNKQKNFSACLTAKNAVLLGQGTDVTTFQQLLGLFATKNYVDCSQNLQQCQQLGQSAGLQGLPAPAVLYNNTIYQGFRDSSFVSSITGCSLA